MSKLSNQHVEKKPREQSFTLIEVIIAVGMLTAVALQMVGGQGNVFGIIEYSQRATEASWLAKRLMSQVEYYWHVLDFKDLATGATERDQTFKLESGEESDYLYTIEIKDWKLPLFDLLMSGGPKPEGEEEQEAWREQQEENPMGALPGLETVINQVFEGQILKIATVSVSWPEGARRNSIELSYLLTNQKKLDEYLLTKRAPWEAMRNKAIGSAPAAPTPPAIQPPTGQPPAPVPTPQVPTTPPAPVP